jgi:hypothetical protein
MTNDAQIESLRRAVDFGMHNGKKNLIVDLDTLYILFESRDLLLEGLKPFAESAARPGRLDESMNGKPLDDNAVLGLGVRVSAWKRAIELTQEQL